MRVSDLGEIACPLRAEGPNGELGDGAEWRDAFEVAEQDPFHAVSLYGDEVARLRRILGPRWTEWREIVNRRTDRMPDTFDWPTTNL